MDKIDTQGMYKVYDKWPEIAKKSYESDLKSVDFSNIDHIVLAGMGGSGAIGDLFESILSKTDIHVNVVKGYLLPKTVDKNTLVVCISVSGNTIETLTILESAQKLDCKIIAFSSGGKMESLCKKSTEFRKIDMIHSPRASFVKFIYSILYVLNSVLPIKKEHVIESITELEKMSSKISSLNLIDSNPSLHLAKSIQGSPCIYYPYGLYAAAIRFKSSLQENVKVHAFVEDVIEMCHNGIMSWEKPSNFKPILIRGTDDYEKTQERWDIVKEYFKKNNIFFQEVLSIDGNILSKLVCLIYLLDFSSIYRAILSEMNPSTVKSIDFIKEKLELCD